MATRWLLQSEAVWSSWMPWLLVPALLVFSAAGVLLVCRWAVARREIGRLEEGLRKFAREVEQRLDAKLDRLEALVREGDRILGGLEEYAEVFSGLAAGKEEEKGQAIEPDPGAETPGEGAGERFRAITPAARDRVLALARAGKRPESISEAVGLRRGEVDLILGLKRIAERGGFSSRQEPSSA